ncbi:hypothetical protein EBR21_10730 [bacterium]|nr:hypothetical protein [bacterium]
MNVFRTATTQAIRDIIADHGSANRFGISLTEADVEAICTRVVDLFEMTLNLRAQVGNTGSIARENETSGPAPARNSALKPQRWEQEPAAVPTTKAASEVYDFSHLERKDRGDSLPQLAPKSDSAVDLKLPRKRISVSQDEREILLRRAQSPSVAVSQTP